MMRSDFTAVDFAYVRDMTHYNNWLLSLIKTYGVYKEYNRNFSTMFVEF